MTPVDREFQEVNAGYAQYYKVSYDVRNAGRRAKKVGLSILFDTMIDDNDNCVISADGRLIKEEIGLAGATIPSELMFYRTEGDTSDMMGAAIIRGHGATPPDRMVIGRWPELHQVKWRLNPQRVRYGDSAYFLQWDEKHVQSRAKMSFVTYYGLPSHKEPELSIIIEDNNHLTIRENIYFEHDEDELDLNAKMKIGEILSRDDIVINGVLLNGYADVTGQDEFNFALSQRRISNVGEVFEAYGIGYVPKPFGIEKSEHTELNEAYGNAWDRRVEMVIYYRVKRDNVLSLPTALGGL